MYVLACLYGFTLLVCWVRCVVGWSLCVVCNSLAGVGWVLCTALFTVFL